MTEMNCQVYLNSFSRGSNTLRKFRIFTLTRSLEKFRRMSLQQTLIYRETKRILGNVVLKSFCLSTGVQTH